MYEKKRAQGFNKRKTNTTVLSPKIEDVDDMRRPRSLRNRTQCECASKK